MSRNEYEGTLISLQNIRASPRYDTEMELAETDELERQWAQCIVQDAQNAEQHIVHISQTFQKIR